MKAASCPYFFTSLRYAASRVQSAELVPAGQGSSTGAGARNVSSGVSVEPAAGTSFSTALDRSGLLTCA